MVDERLLTVRNLVVAFGNPGSQVPVVKNVSFQMTRGSAVALVGESGSGKTVTSLAIIGLVGKGDRRQTVAGSIAFTASDGSTREITTLDGEAMRALQGSEIAMIFQEPMTSLNPVLRVGEQIAEVIERHQDLPRRRAWEMAVDLMTRVGIPDAARRVRSYPHQLSGGMRQRVMIAMALSCNPSLLIADEPTTALDATIQAQILDLIRELKARRGSAILFITHDLGVVSEIADHVVVMYAGHVLEEGPTAALLANPLHPYTRGLIDCVPRLHPADEPLRQLMPIPGEVADPARPPAGCPFNPRCTERVEGICTTALPALEEAGGGRRVRCARWREIGVRAA